MELNRLVFYYILLICLGINATKTTYWPPSIDVPLEKRLISLLKEGCDINTITPDNPQLVTMVTETQSGETVPLKFLEIPSGKLIEPDLDCDDCDSKNFTLNGINYNFEEFNCKTLCIFTAVQNKYNDCRRGENFDIGIMIKNDYIKLMADCHNYEKTNLTYMRNTVYKKLGHYSRKILDGNEKCRQKCMPVCMQPIKMIDSNNVSVTNDREFQQNLIHNFCMVKSDEHVFKYFLNVQQDVCSSATSINLMKLILTSVIFLILFKNILK